MARRAALAMSAAEDKEEDVGGVASEFDWLLKSWEIHRAPSNNTSASTASAILRCPSLAVYGLLQNTAFGPDDIERLVTAYE
jgi:hypothetical protein